MMPLFSQVETTLGGTLRLFTLLGGAEAISEKQEKHRAIKQSFLYFPLITHIFSNSKFSKPEGNN